MPSDSVELKLFGPGKLLVNGQEVIGPGKPLFLLAYLGSQPHRRAGRGRIIDLFWGDVPASQARVTLRQTLLQLRRRLPVDAVFADDDQLMLNPLVTVDRDAILQAFEQEDWHRVVDISSGSFLDNAAVPGGEVFERWVDGERQRMRDLVETAVVAATRERLFAGQGQAAIAFAVRWRDMDRGYQAAGVLLVATLLDVGETARARLEADALLHDLAERSQLISASTREVIARATTAPETESPDVDGVAMRPELVGRATLFANLVAAHRDSQRGRVRRVLLIGGPGVGKTRLLQAIAERLNERANDTVVVRAVRGAREVEGAVLGDCVTALGSRRGAIGVSATTATVLLAVAPALEARFPGSTARDRRTISTPQVVSAFEELLHVLSDERPQALLLDDIHWWDSLSQLVICAVLSRFESGALLVVATSRRPYPEFPADQSYQVEALELADLETLLRSIGDVDSIPLDDVVVALHRVSGGNPQLVLEALRWLMDRGALILQAREWQLLDVDVLQRIDSKTGLLNERIAKLPPRAIRSIEWLAVAEEPLPKHLFPVMEVQLEDGGFVVLDDETVSLAHETIGERVAAGFDDGRKVSVQMDLSAAILAFERPNERDLRLAGQLAVKASNAELTGRVFTRWRRTAETFGDPVAQWSRFLGLPVATVRPLLRTVPLWRRLTHRHITLVGTLAALMLVGAVAAVEWPVHAARLTIPGQPQRFLHVFADSVLPEMVVEGIASPGVVGSVSGTVDMHVQGDGITLSGQTRATANRGRVAFSRVRALGHGVGRIWFTNASLDSIPGPWVDVGASYLGRIGIEGGVIAGQSLVAGRPTIRVRPGATLAGTLRLKMLTLWGTGSIVLGIVPRWGVRQRQHYISFAPFPDADTTLVVPLWDSVAALHSPPLTAPRTPGRYQLIILAAAERDFQYVAAGTNWTVGRPLWNQGNDVFDWSSQTVDSLARNGHVIVPVLYDNNRRATGVRLGAVIDVVVTDSLR